MRNPDRCNEYGCGNKRADGRKLCHKHRMRKQRANNPIKACYYALRDNAKKRGILFTLSFEYFKSFVTANDYIANTGHSGGAMTIDRENNLLGYTEGNLSVLTRSENSSKYHSEDFKRNCGFEIADGEELPF